MKKQLLLILFAIFVLVVPAKAQERTLEIVKNGQVVYSSATTDIDYMSIINRLPVPKNISAAVAGDKIVVTWDAVIGATKYAIFRSADGVNFSQIGTSSTTTYTDAAPLSGANYYRVQALGADDAQSVASDISNCIITDSSQGSEAGIYLGLIGFNQKITNYPINLLTEETKQGYFDFIDGFDNNNDGTAIYYAVDQAITALQGRAYPADLNSVHIVTFTDGIDNYSLDLYDEIEFGRYSSPDECGDHVKQRLLSEKVSEIGIRGYAVGSRHSNVNSTRFTSTLNRIATSSSLVYELTDMAAVEAKFKEIAKNITEVNKTQNITVSIAGGLANGERIRFTFDLASSNTTPANSNLYIEGTFERTSPTTRTIKNITCKGLSMAETTVVGTKNASTGLYDFTFKDIATSNKVLINEKKTLEWWGNPWQMDDEFHPDQNTKTEILTHSAAIILVLDCTYSLGDKFSQMQSSAKSFIATLLNQSYDEGTTGTGGADDPNSGRQTFTVNGVSFDMIRVEGGTFAMGATSEQDEYESDERPVHQVTLSEYMIGETEVTQALWYAVMGSNPSKFSGNNKPVEYVSWEDCQEFISRLNQLTGKSFRLPTEAEWEFAARGGNKTQNTKYSGSNNIFDVAWYDGNNNSMTYDVKTKLPNPLGLYDMSGNVWEWCVDWYGSYSSSSQTNPTGASSGSYRVLRGGGWYGTAADCRVSNRYYSTPGYRDSNFGLRLAY